MKKVCNAQDVYEIGGFRIVDVFPKGIVISPTIIKSYRPVYTSESGKMVQAFYLPSLYKGPLFSIPSTTICANSLSQYSILVRLSMLHQDTPPFIRTDIKMDVGYNMHYPMHVVEPFIQSYCLASMIMNDEFNWEQLCVEMIEISDENNIKNAIDYSSDIDATLCIHRFLKLNQLHCSTNKIFNKIMHPYGFIHPVYNYENNNLIGYAVPIPVIEAFYLIPVEFADMVNNKFSVEFKLVYMNQFDEEKEFCLTATGYQIFEMCAGFMDAIFYHTLLNCDPRVDHTNLTITCKLDDSIIGSREYSYLEERGFKVSVYSAIEDIIKDFNGTPTKMREE